MQTRPRRVREHIKHIILWFAVFNVNLVGVVIFPELLPLFLYIVEVVFHVSQVKFSVRKPVKSGRAAKLGKYGDAVLL
jgi:hypothetical protein